MRPGTGGSEPEPRNEREWILRCEGFRVYAPDGMLVGIVTEVIYEPSARWDRPNAFRLRSGAEEVFVPIAEVREVDAANRTIQLVHRSC